MRSGVLKIYKNTGAAQFSLIPPQRDEQRGFVQKDGAVLVEVAPCDGKDANGNIKAFWDQKLKFAISIADIASLMDRANPKAGRLYHKFQGNSKSLQFVPGTGQYEGTYMLRVEQGSGDTRQQVAVPLTNGEYELIMRLIIGCAAPKLIGWD
jgi:hypothetical protein